MLIKYVLLFCLTFAFLGCESKVERAQKHMESAQELYEKGDLESAKIEFNNALSSEPDKVDALFGLAIILEEEKKWPQYYNFLRRIIELQPQHLEAKLRFANLNLASGKIDEAIKIAGELVVSAAADARVWVLKANIAVRIDDKQGAKEFLTKALAIDANDAEALLLLSNIYMAEGQFEKVLETLDTGIKHNAQSTELSQSAFFYAMKIRALNEIENYDQAIDVFDDIIKLDPENPAAYQVLSKQYVKLGKKELARDVLVNFADQYPSNNSVLNVVSFYETHYGNEDAEKRIQDYTKRYPNLFSLNFVLSDFYLRNGKYDEARNILIQAIDKAPSITEKLLAKNQLAILEFAQLKLNDVIIIADDILQEDPENIRAITTKARVALAENKTESAVRLLRSALSNNSQNPFVLYLLAQAHEQQGMVDLANNHYQRSVVLSSYNTDFSMGYVRFLLDENRIDQAELLLEKIPVDGEQGIAVLEQLAEVKLKLAKWGEAERIAQKIKEIDGDTYKTAHIMGLVYSGTDQVNKSIDAFQTAYSESPDNFRPLQSLVDTYLAAEQVNQAKLFLQKILQADSDNYYALILEGRVYAYANELKKAEHSLMRASELQPQRPESYMSLYEFYKQQKRFENAEYILDKAHSQLPTNLDIAVKLATLKVWLNDLSGAKDIYEKWIAREPKTPIIVNNLAILLLNSKDKLDHDRALTLAKSLSSSNIPHFQDTLGWAYYLSGQIQSSIRYLEQAEKSLRDVPEFNYHFGLAHIAQSDTQRGILLLEKAIAGASKNTPWLGDAELALANARTN